jgi:hypothetical protein
MKNILVFIGLGLYALISVAQVPAYFTGQVKYKFQLEGGMAELAKAFIPQAISFKFGEKNMAMITEGGMMSQMGNIIYNAETNEAFALQTAEKTAWRMNSKSGAIKLPDPVVLKESEMVTIAGYPCNKYKIVTRDEKGNPSISYVWATEKLNLYPTLQGTATKQMQSFMIKGIKGLPLKMMNTEETLGTTILTAIEIKPETVLPSEFLIPKGFVVKDFDPMSSKP